jgi:DNA-binding transcriptional ArsR family regulator
MAISSSAQRVRGVPAVRQPAIAVDHGLGFEALIGLGLFLGGEPEHTYEIGPGWFKAVRRRASPLLRQAARKYKDGHGHIALAGLLHESTGKTVSDLVALVRRDRSGDVKRALLHADPQRADAVLRGDPTATREYLQRLSVHHREWGKRIVRADPLELATEIADLLELWNAEIFSDLGPPLEEELKTGAQAARRLSRQLPVDRLIVKMTRGVEYRPEPWIDEVVLIPTVLNRPWVDIAEFKSTKFFFFPASAGAVTPDVELVEVYKALGDETRLRILRLMSEGITSLTDLSEKLGLAKSTVHGHMVILRIAGLTRSVVGGEGKGYVVNERPDLNALLDAYLRTRR